MSWETNVYYNSEKHGLTTVAEVEYSDGCYEFDTRVVWQHKDGRLFTARDSGCSCPTPFENYPSVESLEEFDFDEVLAEIDREIAARNEWGSGNPNLEVEKADFVAKIAAVLHP